MGFIKTDPNQSKAVIPLIAILVGAIVVTVLRINPGPVTNAVSSTASVKENGKAAGDILNGNFDPSRNPFKKPVFISAAMKSIKSAMGEPSPAELANSFEQRNRYSNQPLNTQAFKIEPAEVHVAPMPIKAVAKEPERPKPEFKLLATVGNENGFSAVVKSDGADERLVEVGDILEGGFKVKQILADRAVLTDGRDTVIAKRPNS